jgi:hypothetical protein
LFGGNIAWMTSLFGYFLLIRAKTYFQARADSLLSTDR